jgi:hypothetical protein
MSARLPALLCVVVATACASAGTTPRSTANGLSTWSGSFRPRPVHSSAEFGPAVPNRGTGTITVTPIANVPGRVRVDLSVNVGVPPGGQVAWGIFSSACGSAGLILANQNEFAPMDISSTGDGHFRGEMVLTLDPTQSYHVNVYSTSRANDLNDVMMCAELKPEG